MGTIKMKIFKFILEKLGGKYINQAYDWLEGYKTQVFLGMGFVTLVLEFFGYIPQELAAVMKEKFKVSPEELAAVGIGAGLISFLEKLKRHEGEINEFKKNVLEK